MNTPVILLTLGLVAAAAITVAVWRRAASGEQRTERDKSEPAAPPRALLAEDSAVARHIAASLLKGRGWEVHEVENGAQALVALTNRKFDLVILDVQMPEFNGLEVARRVRELEKTFGGHLPILALTGQTLPGDREQCLRSGMDDFVAKPIGAEQLDAALDRLRAGKGKVQRASLGAKTS